MRATFFFPRTRLNLTFIRPLPVVFSFSLQYFQFQRVKGWKMSVIGATPCDNHTIYKAHIVLFIVRLTQQCDVKLSCKQLM